MSRNIILAILASTLLTACGSKDKFEIKGEVVGNPTMNLYMRFYSADAVRDGVTPVQNGKFSYVSSVSEPTLLRLLDNEYRPLGFVYVQNGDKIKVKIDRVNPYLLTATGTAVNEEWTRCANANADALWSGDSQAANDAIEAYIAEHPKAMPAAIMYAVAYDASIDPLRADSVLQSLGVEGAANVLSSMATSLSRFSSADMMLPVDTICYRKHKQDTVEVFTPTKRHSLLTFTADRAERKDSILTVLKELSKEKNVEVLDIMLCADTNQWNRTVFLDSAEWCQGWLPGGIFAHGIDRLAIPMMPYCIVLDSAGTQIYRGTDFAKAAAIIKGE